MLNDISSLFTVTSSFLVYADSLSKYIYLHTAEHVGTLTLAIITAYHDILYHYGNVLLTQNEFK